MNTSLLRNWSLRHNLSTLNFQAFFFLFFFLNEHLQFLRHSFILFRDSSILRRVEILFRNYFQWWTVARVAWPLYIYPEGNHLPSFVSAWFRPFRRRHQVQYHLALLRQLSFYDRLCILRALLPSLAVLAAEALTTLRAVITTERNTPFYREKTINAVLHFTQTFHPFVINRGLCSSNLPVKLMPWSI